MAKSLFMAGVQQVLDDNGDPLAAGKVTFYEPGTTTLKDTYTDATLGTANTNPVILDSNGRPDNATGAIWLNGEYKFKFTTSADVAVGATIDNLNAGTSASSSGGLQQPLNGSFEDDTDLDSTPDNWTLSALTSGTIALDEASQAHGYKSLKFTSGGNGGGTATSTRFDVRASGDVKIEFTYKASAAGAECKVDLKTYDKDDAVVTTHPILNDSATNPTSYETHTYTQTVGATAVRAEIIITGVGAGGTVTAATTANFDNVAVSVVNIDTATTYEGTTNYTTVITRGTAQTPSATNTITFSSIPSWAKEITIILDQLSVDGSTSVTMGIGDGGSVDTTADYKYVATYINSTFTGGQNASSTDTDWFLYTNVSGGHAYNGRITLHNITGNQWVLDATLSSAATIQQMDIISGSKSLGGVLNIIELYCTVTDAFDAGTINIFYKG